MDFHVLWKMKANLARYQCVALTKSFESATKWISKFDFYSCLEIENMQVFGKDIFFIKKWHTGADSEVSFEMQGIYASNNGLSPVQRQAIIWSNADLLSIRPFGTNFSENSTEIQNFSLKKMHLK